MRDRAVNVDRSDALSPDRGLSHADAPGSAEATDLQKQLLTQSGDSMSKELRWHAVRLMVVIAVCFPVFLLAVARSLEPSSSGLGTHQQLGLPPCSMRLVFGIRCPGCGMTTSWAHFTRGAWISSVRANAGGFLLAFATVCLFPVLVPRAWKMELPSHRFQLFLIVVVCAVGTITLVDWLTRVFAAAG